MINKLHQTKQKQIKISTHPPAKEDGYDGDMQLITSTKTTNNDLLYVKVNGTWKVIGIDEKSLYLDEREILNINSIKSKNAIEVKSFGYIPISITDDIGTTEHFLSYYGYDVEHTDIGAIRVRMVCPCEMKMNEIYYIPNDWNPNDSSNTQTWKVYRFTPDGSTNTGDMDTKSNWTLVDEVTLTNAELSVTSRGHFVKLNREDCTFKAGDSFAITVTNSVHVTTTNDEMRGHILVEYNWSKRITSNI